MATTEKKQSSFIAHRSYDPATLTVTVELMGGATYSYQGIPPEVYDAWDKAPSEGRYYTQCIKGRADCTKIADAKPKDPEPITQG
jgi:KTSC domain